MSRSSAGSRAAPASESPALKRNPKRRKRDAAGVDRRIIGWEYVHIAIDDCTRLAYAEVLTNEKATTAVGFLRRAVAFFARHGITVERVMTDNGAAYISIAHAVACRTLGLCHIRTRPRRPQTNGKAERFVRTMLGGWAYGAIYRNSPQRTQALDGWLWHYNHQRRHSALGHKPPIARLNERTNLLGTYTYPSAMAVIERDVDSLVAHLRWPLEHRKRTRTTNLLERTFVEVRRRTEVIGRFPGGTSALSLVWAALAIEPRLVMTPKTVAEIERLRRQQQAADAIDTKEVVAA